MVVHISKAEVGENRHRRDDESCLNASTSKPPFRVIWPLGEAGPASGGETTNHPRLVESRAAELRPLRFPDRAYEAVAGDADAERDDCLSCRIFRCSTSTTPPVKSRKRLWALASFPRRRAADAAHIAISSVYDIDILLTWNCQHIANAAIMKEMGEIAGQFDFDIPILCTPEELLGV